MSLCTKACQNESDFFLGREEERRLPSRTRSSRLVRALPGTHELVVRTALRFVPPGSRALDLGAGSGALAEHLQFAGLQVTAAVTSQTISN